VTESELRNEIRLLHEKIDRILLLLEKKRTPKSVSNGRGAEPLTSDEIHALQERFEELFAAWTAGNEIAVSEKLEKTAVEDLRRFADANNLNVTAKMSKERVLQLIGARFREKRQLHK
jgi:hypothetical protein